ncbi:MAG TPA: pyridoxal phosphate-dependent aminotransferase [Syntrophorhabdales bacterium]|nr:pyridoxal phosphate-dependent aminotransferase [Syntrophorhabdales bacterium]
MVSNRARSLKPSPTLAITAKEKALRAQGLDVVGFGAGEPDFDTPMHIKKAAIDAILDGYTKYTPAAGSEELKDAIMGKFKRDNDLEYGRDEVIVTCGGKHALYGLFQAIFQEGDEVIVPTPYWVSYPVMVELAGATPVFVETYEEEEFQLTAEMVKKHLTSKTKGIILNYPSNPSGSVYYLSCLEEIGKLAVENGIYLISDEIYDKIVYDGYKHTSIASLGQPIKETTIITHGVSKTYSMTGWRIGFAAGARDIIQAMSNIQSQSTSNPTSISQKAALAALTGPQDFVGMMVGEFTKRRDFFVNGLNSIDGVSCFNPKGAFYVFPCFKGLLDRTYKGRKVTSIAKWAEILLEDFHVAAVPGEEFGKAGYLRLSFATSMEVIEKGLNRIKKAVRALY